MDVACAFHNLRVDPDDALKLGIRGADTVYMDLAIAGRTVLDHSRFCPTPLPIVWPSRE